MASLRHFFRLFVKATRAWSADFAPSMGAAISYYTVFSIAPLLVIVIAMAGAVFGREAVEGEIVAQLSGLIGPQGATLVQTLVAASAQSDKGLAAGLISLAILVVGATTVIAELQSALDRIWHVPPTEQPQGLWAILHARLLSFGLILGLVFLLIVSLAVSAALAAFGALTTRLLPGTEAMLQALNLLGSLFVMTLLFAMIFKLMPSTRIEWRDVWVGAFTTALLFEAGKLLIGLYIGKSSMTETFAAAGSLVILLAWVYYAAQIFLLGAEFTKVYADEHGSRWARRAMEATESTTPALPPAATAPPRLEETADSVARNATTADPALGSPAFRATEAGLRAALAGLYAQVAALVVVIVAGSVIQKQRKRLERTLPGHGQSRLRRH